MDTLPAIAVYSLSSGKGSNVADAAFRFHAELNNFLAPRHRARRFSHPVSQDATLKHMIEALGVPHTEVGSVLLDSVEAPLSRRLQGGESIDVHPHADLPPEKFCAGDEAPVPRFIADAHLGQLAKQMRMLGFDVLYRNDFSDAEVASLAEQEERVVLTRDRDLLIRKQIERGCYLHPVAGNEQLLQVIRRFGLPHGSRALTRCLNCNGLLRRVAKEAVADRVPTYSWRAYSHFFECDECEQVYWEGSHVVRMRQRILHLLETIGGCVPSAFKSEPAG
ncbi:Mut7-C RNAse domain-containing protein [Noviherbaspirillum humi]|nr:Mut7-C RNAse domain-containing protein [Noviherbaspirillum humi]